jgi:HEPN domain-containing protein
MNNIEKQIHYWLSGATEDLESAKVLVDKNRLLHGLFFCHLVIEKALKAHVVQRTSEVSPRTHNLIYLSEKANLVFEEQNELFLGF